ncbi:MAG: MATE family efflux transporter [Erysipelotrichaceae bacterium]|nr:MATE family efflux transporter [Erysipelotrichaceae bacterium]
MGKGKMSINRLINYLKGVMFLAFPIVLQRIVELVVTLIDNLMVGQLGDIPVASCSLVNSFNLLYICACGGVVSAGVIIAAQAWGAGNKDIIRRTVNGCLLASSIVALLFFTISQVFPQVVIRLYTNKDYLIEPASNYLRIIAFSFFPYALTSTYTNILRTTGSTRFGFIVETINSLINAALNYVLIFGNFGFPALGLTGAGIATVIARCIGLLITIVYVYVFDKKLGMRITDRFILPDRKLWKSLVEHGTPILLSDSWMMLNSSFQTMITGRVSDSYIAANSIVHMIWQIAAFTMFGISAAAAISIGNSIGEGNIEEAYDEGDMIVILCLIQGIVAAIVIQIIAPILIPLYKVSDAVALTARRMCYSASFVVFTMTFSMVIAQGLTRAGGMTKKYMIVEILTTFCFSLPLGYIAAFFLKLPEYLIYIIIRSDNILKTIWGCYHVKKRDWITKIV